MYCYFVDDFLKLLRKGVFPYEYMNDQWKKKLKELADIKHFHSKLNHCECKDSDYECAKYIYDYFKCKNLKEHNNLYVMTDLLLLAHIFANYRKGSHKTYGLDPIYCISLPGYANRAMLKYTNAEIKLVTEINIYLIIDLL